VRGCTPLGAGGKNCKPVSRILFHPYGYSYHLSSPFITKRVNLPTLDHRTSSPQTALYMAFQHARFTLLLCYHNTTQALTLHFHPYREYQ
jgi:hypothetical protein